ncbi:MAG: serine hydrolase domain-containing protein, partial [Henriciella sp.]
MTIQDEIGPSDVGLNEERLDAIPHYFAANYLDTGKLPCMATMVSRNGQVVHEAYRGRTKLEGGEPINSDTIFRIYSMTKPITSVAAMMLFEEGVIRLDHPVSKYIPEFAETEVFVKGTIDDFETRKPNRPMEIRDLF